MRKWTKTVGLLFTAVASVYPNQAILVAAEKSGSFTAAPEVSATNVKLLEDATDPFASTAPQAAPSEGRSVSTSEVSVSDAGTVEIHVNDANLVEVLRMLSLQSQKNIIASKDVHGTITANLYDVTVREALDAILHANGYGYREKGSFIYVYTSKELEDLQKAERQMKTEVFRLYYTPAANAQNMIKPVMSTTGQVALTTPATVGIGSTPTAAGGDEHSTDDMLVVTDYPENLEAIRKILAEVDHRPQQILLEAIILRATLNEDNALGIDFTVLGGVDFGGLSSAGSNSGEVLSGAITNNTTAQGVVNNGGGVVGAGTGFTNNVPGGGLRLGFINNNISMFLSALEQTTDTTIMANPKILALNKQKGEVFVGNEDGYYTTVTTETTTSQSVESLKTGTRLIFRPFIGTDSFIRMEIHPEDSDGSVKANGLPSKSTTEVTSNVMVKDGHTIVIGGLFRESSSSARSQVPFLGNLPLAGNLFRSQRDRTVREEVIILLTPHIVKDEVSYSAQSQEALKQADRLRVGVRRGMMPFGRERLAESSYESAKTELAKPEPNRQKALWHLNCATNLNPRFSEAITLKEQLTGQELTTSDNSMIRYFVSRSIINDRALPAAPTTNPATMPTAGVPTTQPLVALEPTTAPSIELVEAPATAPATEEPVDETAAVPTTTPVAAAPVTRPIAAAPTTAPVTLETNNFSLTTQPSAPVIKSLPNFTITELETDEVNPDAEPAE